MVLVVVALPLLSIAAHAARPEHAINLTVFHVGPGTHRSLTNVNSGDAAGDAFFMLRAAGLQWLCSNSSGLRRETFDCADIEQSGTDLLVSQFVIEVDSRFSGYAECNTDNGTSYNCDCRDRSGRGSSRRQLQHHHHSSVPCNATVGRIRVLDESSFASVPPDPSAPPSFMNSPYRFWYYNLANKLPTGTWYSTLDRGECGNPAANGTCDWRTVRRVKTVHKTCQESFVISTVERIGADCFAGCDETTRARTRAQTLKATRGTKCWTDCFYDTVIGPRSNDTVYSDGAEQGMRANDLIDAWLAAFRSEDPTQGGCRDVHLTVED